MICDRRKDVWDETVAKRGSCDIVSCLWLWFQSLPETIEKVTLFINILTMMLAAVNVFKSIKQINQKCLESCHTQM